MSAAVTHFFPIFFIFIRQRRSDTWTIQPTAASMAVGGGGGGTDKRGKHAKIFFSVSLLVHPFNFGGIRNRKKKVRRAPKPALVIHCCLHALLRCVNCARQSIEYCSVHIEWISIVYEENAIALFASVSHVMSSIATKPPLNIHTCTRDKWDFVLFPSHHDVLIAFQLIFKIKYTK